MNEISLPDSEAIIDAATRGEVLDGHEALGSVLNALHAPGDVQGTAPPITSPSTGTLGRVARRTAIAASATVLGLAGVAAAGSGYLDPVIPGGDPVVEMADEETGELPEITEVLIEVDDIVSAEEPAEAHDGAESVDDATETSAKGPAVEIEGVDVTDGVDDDELEIACGAVGNHGEYVRLVARDKLTEHDGNHGDRVRSAAGSECGTTDNDGANDDENDPDDETTEEEVESDDDTSDGDPHDDERGKGNGNQGNGKGNGHSRGNDD